MIKFIIFIVILIFIFNIVNKFILQLMYQNLVFIIIFIFLLNFPLNNLNYWVKIYYFFGCDFYSIGLILLRFWIMSLMILIREIFLVKLNYFYYINILNFLLIFLIICFLTINLILFYIFFESRLIPVFMLIMGWGHQVDRIQAGVYIIIYTILGSFPLLIIIIFIYIRENLLILDLLEIRILN